jgi:hypothetical protein
MRVPPVLYQKMTSNGCSFSSSRTIGRKVQRAKMHIFIRSEIQRDSFVVSKVDHSRIPPYGLNRLFAVQHRGGYQTMGFTVMNLIKLILRIIIRLITMKLLML